MNRHEPPSSEGTPNWLLQLWRNLRLAWHLLRDPVLPAVFKMIPVVALVYLLFPADLLPDWIPGLGQMDDLSVALLGLKLFIDACPSSIVEKHQARMSSVDATYRVVDEETGSEGQQERLPASNASDTGLEDD